MNTKNSLLSKIIRVLKKTGSFVLFLTVLVLNEGFHIKNLQAANVVIQDEVRKSQSVELLKSLSVKLDAKSFEGDANFYRYITKYLKKRNNKINAEKFTQALMNLSKDQFYDPIFILAVIKTESSFNNNAVGSAGEIGLMQIKPDTAKWICDKKNIKWKGAQALKNPEYNILIGANYFKYLMQTLKSQSLKYINAYNMGLAGMKRTPSSELKKHPYFGKVTENYLAIYSELKKIKKNIKRSNKVS
ncbi:MAG: lytic transglycosylase domain-containing protein [Bdellovibrionota bacterium]